MAILVQYRVKADRAGENEQFIADVFAALARERPPGIRYASFKAADGVSFTHLAIVETGDGQNPLVALDAFKRFAATIRDRCDEPPRSVEISEVGTYRWFEPSTAEKPAR